MILGQEISFGQLVQIEYIDHCKLYGIMIIKAILLNENKMLMEFIYKVLIGHERRQLINNQTQKNYSEQARHDHM